jgi:hypothetical protein
MINGRPTCYDDPKRGSMSKYCPAGKIECEYFTYDNIVCPAKDMMVQDGVKFEVCPWPSRQRPVEKRIINGIYPVCEPDEPKAGDIILPADSFDAYIMGVNEGVERVRTEFLKIMNMQYRTININEALDILAACKAKI